MIDPADDDVDRILASGPPWFVPSRAEFTGEGLLAERFTDRIWTCADGRTVPLAEMEDSHLRNALAFLERQGFIGPRTLALYTGKNPCEGDAARDAFEQERAEALKAPVNPWVDVLRDELLRREGGAR